MSGRFAEVAGEVRHRYWVSNVPGSDAYQLFVAQYTYSEDGETVRSEYLTDGGWVEIPEMEVVPAAIRFDGREVEAMRGFSGQWRTDVADHLAEKILPLLERVGLNLPVAS